MMHYKILHYDRRWRRVDNHMDARHCPDCGATVHGSHGQRTHRQWHVELAELLNDISERAGIEERQQPEAPWTAAVDGEPTQLEAAE